MILVRPFSRRPKTCKVLRGERYLTRPLFRKIVARIERLAGRPT